METTMATTHGPGPFGLLLRQYRAAAGMSQEELAERAHLSRRGISDLERGERRSPHPGTARRLAQALALDETQRASLLASIHPLARSDSSAGQVPDGLQQVFANVQRSELESLTTGQVDVEMHHNLPVHLTSFIGRAQEAAEIRSVLGNTRLLTLTGPGGVGKRGSLSRSRRPSPATTPLEPGWWSWHRCRTRISSLRPSPGRWGCGMCQKSR